VLAGLCSPRRAGHSHSLSLCMFLYRSSVSTAPPPPDAGWPSVVVRWLVPVELQQAGSLACRKAAAGGPWPGSPGQAGGGAAPVCRNRRRISPVSISRARSLCSPARNGLCLFTGLSSVVGAGGPTLLVPPSHPLCSRSPPGPN
jgi:hypothetical protein